MSPFNNSSSRGRRGGYTLIELVVATGSATVLVGGLASTVLISSRALEHDSTPGADANRGALVLAQMAADFGHAQRFIERTTPTPDDSIAQQSATAIAFSLPDRNGDSVRETVRYTWSGTAGDPLMYQFNSKPAVAIAADARQFNLSAMTLQMAAVAFIVPDRNGDSRPETLRYSWSGAAGDPLMYQFNSEPAVAVAEDVQQFQLSAVTRLIVAP